MMELETWKKGAESHIPAFEVFLKNVLLRTFKVNLADAGEGDNEEAAAALADGATFVRSLEKNFETEIVMGFSPEWTDLLSQAILGTEASQNDEVARDLMTEFAGHWLDVVRNSFEQLGVKLDLMEADLIKSGQLKRALNFRNYFTVRLTVDPAFEMEASDDRPPLELWVALAHPSPDKAEMLEVAFSEGNPFENGDYVEISSANAGHVDVSRVGNGPDGEAPQSNIRVKGKTVEFESFNKASAVNNDREIRNIDILKNVEMKLSVELGRREMPLGKILKLVKGSVIELEKLAGEPVEILVNGHTIAQGDVVVIDEHFGVRISHLLASAENMSELGK